MKKVLLIACIALFGFNVNAQGVSFGAKAGVNFASLTGDDVDDLDGRTSFHIGAVAEISISEKFSVQPELIYSAQGAKESFEGEDFELNVDYLNIPVLAKYYVAKGFSLEAGPQVGLLLSAKIKAGGEEEDFKDEVKGIDFGANLGLGYKLDNGLNFSAKYIVGLANISEDSDDSDVKNSVVQVSVGYSFN